jgi:hypothetical protein
MRTAAILALCFSCALLWRAAVVSSSCGYDCGVFAGRLGGAGPAAIVAAPIGLLAALASLVAIAVDWSRRRARDRLERK